MNDFNIRISYIVHMKGHKDSSGNIKEWVVKSHETNKILGSYSSKEEAEKALKRMHYFKHKESFIGIESLDEIIKESSKKEEIDYDKRFLVQRIVKDYDEGYIVDIKTFDKEEEAEEFMWKLWGNDNLDSYRIKDLKYE